MSWVGIYLPDTSRIPDMVARGITRFQQWGPNSGVSAAVEAAGGKVWVTLEDAFSGVSGYNPGTLASYVNATKGLAVVEGYHMKDEPDIGDFSASVMRTAYNDLRALTTKPAECVIRYPYRDGAFGTHPGLAHQDPDGYQFVTGGTSWNVCEIDAYVIPYGPATQVGDEVNATVDVVGGRQVDATIQAFSWGTTYGPKLRLNCYPTVSEMITMGVTARQNGATNFWIYAWRGDIEQPGLTLEQFNPSCWAAMSTITSEWLLAGHDVPRLTTLRLGTTTGALYGNFAGRVAQTGVGPRIGARLINGALIGGRMVN